MSKKAFHIIALLGCLTYLIGNIAYDLWVKNPYIYYIPLGVMTVALILLAYQHAQSYLIRELWLCFLLLSISQLIKFTIFNPFVQTVNDYAWLLVVIVVTFRRINRKNK